MSLKVVLEDNVQFKKYKKSYLSGEVTRYVIYKFRGYYLKNVFLDACNMDVLNSAAWLRSLKLSISGNAFPILAYCVGNIPSESINTLPKITQDGSHLVAPSSIVKNWLLLQASKETTISRLFSDKIFMELLRKSGSIVTYRHLAPYSVNERVSSDNLLPVHPSLGMLSSQAKTSDLAFNSLFFTMESSDMQNFHTLFGQPYGLTINNGYVTTPALFNRGTLLMYKSGKVVVQTLALEDMDLKVDNINLTRDNSVMYRRPQKLRTDKSKGDIDLVVINDQIMSWKEDGDTEIPDAGFVIRVDKKTFSKIKRYKIAYAGLPDVRFAVQGGPILVKKGTPMEGFQSEEFGGEIEYPPTVFPLDWDATPAARTAIGYDGENFVLVGVEGCNSYPYEPGFDSRGFTLEELTEVMLDNGVTDAINLDGGGSTQVRYLGGKALQYADRMGIKCHEFERPIAAMITVDQRR